VMHLKDAQSRTKLLKRAALVFGGLLILLYFFFGSSSTNVVGPKITETTIPDKTKTGLDKTETVKFQTEFLAASTKRLSSTSYPVNYPPDCYSIDCQMPNNYHAYEPCHDPVATNFNILGVKSMERMVLGSYSTPADYPLNYLRDAQTFFAKAVKQEPTCLRARVNLALTLMQTGAESADKSKQINEAIQHMDEVISKEPYCRHYAVRGFFYHILGDHGHAHKDWVQAFKINPRIGEGRYMGIIHVNDTQMHRHQYAGVFNEFRHEVEYKCMRHALLYTEFSPVSLAGYALLHPEAHETFLQNRWIVLQRIIPPFIFTEVSNFYRYGIDKKLIQFGDPQSQRYYSGNDRMARYLQYGLTDLIRKVVAHNVIPTYTYFGGYVGGAELTPHTDRHSCEFTLSLTVYQNPDDEPWPLGLGNKPLFERNDDEVGGSHPLPPEPERMRADLHNGDGLLFMGRHLVHWRYGKQKEGHSTYNIFIHYVQYDYKRYLD